MSRIIYIVTISDDLFEYKYLGNDLSLQVINKSKLMDNKLANNADINCKLNWALYFGFVVISS